MDVSKSFGEETVLHHISYDFKEGRIYGIVGNNGSGKTVLMKCICGFLIPDSGEITVNYKRIGKDMDFPPDTGIIIETPGCDNDIKHLLERASLKPKVSYSFRDDTLIMAFVKSGLGVTISQEMVLHAFARDVVSVPLVPESFRTIGLAFAKTNNSVVARTLLEYCRSGAAESTEEAPLAGR